MLAVVAICMAMPAHCTAARLLSQDDLHRLGLTRAWFAQAQMNPSRNHIERALLTGDRLTVLTSAGVVQEFNALTGEALWTAPIGNENYPSLGPAVNDKYVALVNGSTLYVLDRTDGRPHIIRPVGGAPGAAPAVAENYVFVPLVKGRIEGYPLSTTDKKAMPWFYQASGRAMVAPLATPESLVFTTDAGFLYVGHSDKPGMRFRLETGSEIVAPPSYLKPYVYVASTSGEVFAMHELSGVRRWKFATGFPIERAAAPVGKRVFVTSIEPELYCIDGETGDEMWEAPHVKQFAAASKTRVYGVDDLGALVVLDGAKGAMIGRITADQPIKSLVNDQTDRVYLVSAEGTIECLREMDSKEVFYHNPKPVESAEPAPGETPTAKAADAPAPVAKPAEPAADEKPAAAEKPAGDFGVKDSDNPFGE